MTRRTIPMMTMVLLLACAMLRAQGLPVPKLITHVTDQAGVLTPDERAELEGELTAYEDSTGNQFAVLIIPSLQGEVLEEYALRVAEQNKLGTEKNDNGLLLLVAIEEHQIRIEVGYGLEGPIPDATTALIRENEITPRFRQGDYFDGLRAGLRALMLAGAGEYRAEPKDNAPEGFGIGGIIMAIIVIIIISRMMRGGRGRGGGGGSVLPWIIAANSFGRGWGGRSSGGGFGGGGSFGGGGGGWSGGGGSFGGGGSSGSW